jgi:hypothetical protein
LSVDKIKIGDLVVATDPETGATAAKAVTHMITGDGDKNLVSVTVDTDGRHGDRTGVLVATDHHPFWIPRLHQWVDATDLQPGQWLQTSTGTWVQITAINRWTQHARVHNLTVDNLHTYYVLAGTTPVLVHNNGSAPDPDMMLYRFGAGPERSKALRPTRPRRPRMILPSRMACPRPVDFPPEWRRAVTIDRLPCRNYKMPDSPSSRPVSAVRMTRSTCLIRSRRGVPTR